MSDVINVWFDPDFGLRVKGTLSGTSSLIERAIREQQMLKLYFTDDDPVIINPNEVKALTEDEVLL